MGRTVPASASLGSLGAVEAQGVVEVRSARRREVDPGQSMHVYLKDAWRERAMLGGRRKLKVKAFMSVREVKATIARLVGIPASRQRLYWRLRELKDHRTLEESGIHQSGATLVFDARPADECGGDRGRGSTPPTTPPSGACGRCEGSLAALEPVSCAALEGPDGSLPSALRRALLRARRALCVGGKAPELALDGTGGTYFLHGPDGRRVACFKPADEEPFCVNNPRHFVGYPGSHDESLAMRRGVRPGEAYVREVAAYLLDRSAGGLAGVPETTVVECRHTKFHYADRTVKDKIGSLQVYVNHDGVAEDYGVDRLVLSRVQAIAALDVRALNCDRNGANMLVTRRGASLAVVPIDHGFCLPEVLEIEWFDWCWIDWPQMAAPVCDDLKRAISLIDPAADAAVLRDTLGLRPKALRLSRASSELLKRGVAAGLVLRDIASLVVVPQDASNALGTNKSRLAAAIDRAADLAALALDEDRHPGRQRTASPDREVAALDDDDELGTWREAKSSPTSAAASPMLLLSETKLRITISQDDREEKRNMVGPHLVKTTTTTTTTTRPVPIQPPSVATPASAAVVGCSPRWVDGLPADVASRLFDDASSAASSDDDWRRPRSPRASARRRRRRSHALKTSPEKQHSAPISTRSFETPLVRLHSCPALADVFSSEEDSALATKARRLDDGDTLARRVQAQNDADFDRHFFHFLDGILDDLVRWKLLNNKSQRD
ncbi:hypothetical protein CTAYLR_004250 [Chrysophaeum taylorii]|uniref:Ubiquitin-like domain-containing protein n=1 Tax=Chrysophaeum taylorii TaxID=2483200 RepID=A0AAD7UCI1_9STRA|nr:hypothetical protein CTAYLR_004250 [Chrysophaeum taylorii]